MGPTTERGTPSKSPAPSYHTRNGRSSPSSGCRPSSSSPASPSTGRTGLPEARLFPSIEGLIFRANAYNHGIKGYTYEFIDQKDIPGLAPFLEETKDPELICRVHVTLGDGTDVVEHGSVRLSEIKLYQSRRTGKMVARSPVARSNPTELAVKRALARALRWGTGFGGTALDELPVPESEEARERAGLKGGPAALPSPQDGPG